MAETHWFGFNAHGVQFVPELPGPSMFENINGIGWTDLLGYRRGDGVRYRGRSGTNNWFHCAIPTLGLYQHAAMELAEFHVSFMTFSSALVDRIHLWGGNTQIYGMNGLSLSGDFTKTPFSDCPNPVVKPNGGINLCVHVTFSGPDASDILFTGAYARFSITFA
jgi:uncharacterized protein DUF6623